jgi:hypothetical protein
MDILNNLQKEVMIKANKKAKIYCNNLHHDITNKFIDNNIDEKYIDIISNYIKNNSYVTTMIPITTKYGTIKNIFEIFIENPKLKNIFEVINNQSSLKFREEVEDLLFFKIYSKCDSKDRPKYGSINIYDNISGDNLCRSYGDICLKYKDDIKERTTFTFGDSFNKMLYICTYQYLGHILWFFDINSIKRIIDIINGNNSINITNYIEAQIHGDVDITRDIENIRLSKNNYDNNKEIIEKFMKTYPNIEILVY